MGRGTAAIAAVCASLLVACGVNGGGLDGSSPSSPSKSSKSSEPSEPASEVGLIAAVHPECQQLGEAVLKYLATGDTSNEPKIEQVYADARATILAQPLSSQAGLARARASDVIDACDLRVDEQAAAQADAEAQAEAQAAAEQRAAEAERQRQETAAAEEAAEQARADKFASACTAVGGQADAYWCTVDYPGWQDQYVPMAEDGTLIADDVASNRDDCATGLEDAQTSAAEGFPWTELPKFHEDTGVCTYGSP
ncbi:MAG: hypothetical protein JWM47_3671 [Acidimicrobiales bacterium]|nr:hypothetical protein [Acidimicrobiales bacterium]